jgi:hypothetical protein
MMAGIAALIQAIAALLWPLVALYALRRYAPEIKSLAARLRKGKLLGQEIELSDSLDQLDRSAANVETQIAASPIPSRRQLPGGQADDPSEDSVQRVFTLAAQSPKAALLLLGSEIERELRHLLASLGRLIGRRTLPVAEAFAELEAFGGLPKDVANSVRLFWDVRNRVVHGHSAVDDEILRAIDSGVTILKALRSIPHEVNVVYHAGVPIYSDPDCHHLVGEARGVMLETTPSDGGAKALRIFPTSRSHFKKGRRVAWEWSEARRFGPAWYQDPDSGDLKQAWDSSIEFVGRHLDDI